MTCPEPLNEHSQEQAQAARGCLVGLAICVLSAGIVLGVLVYTGWWLEALSLIGILLVIAGLRSEGKAEDPGRVSPGWVGRHR